jgi:hypothetical protein
MTQIGEPVDFGILADSETTCPFNHDIDEPPVVENEFKGDAGALEDNMANQIGTSTDSVPKEWQLKKPKKIVCPNYDPKHKFFDERPPEEYPVVIDGYRYPVTCAPHHLIPAQESLKHARKLGKYMVKEGSPEPVTNGDDVEGICYADVGYNVNGSHNGSFLPGSYGVTSVGTGDWKSAPSVMSGEWEDDSTADGEASAALRRIKPRRGSSKALTGLRHQVHPDNKKWLYVKAAVELGKGQFHDRHPDYSDLVIKSLESIAAEYDKKRNDIKLEVGCKKCQKRFKKYKEGSGGIPTPFKLLNRLNLVSSNYAQHLSADRWFINIYTSKWGLAYMLAVKNGTPGA